MGEENPIASYEDNITSTTVQIKKASLRYINEFIRLTSAPDILKRDIFPDAKEISESMSAYNAVRNYQDDFPLDDRDTKLISVGDGSTPRTATLFAFMSAWDCHSIDPNLKEHQDYPGVDRLTLHKKKVEHFSISADTAVLVAVHSHANLDNAVNSIKADKMLVVAIPCCIKQEISGEEPIEEYADWGNFSPKRNVKIWRLGN